MLSRILNQLDDLLTFAFISLMFGIIKCLSIPGPINWKHHASSLLLSVLVGTMAGALAMQWQFGDYTALTASSVASLLSRDIVMAVLNNRAILSDLLKQASYNIMNKLTTNSNPVVPPPGAPGSDENPL